MQSSDSWLIVGLGNPGPNYSHNRHNIGYMVVDAIADTNNLKFKKSNKATAMVAESRLGYGGPRIILAKSLNYMNTVGQSITALAKYYKVPLAQVIVVHDELDLPSGVMKLKQGGSSAGHNGLKDLTRAFKSEGYLRIRLGIGRPRQGKTANYVLQNFSKQESETVSELISRAQDAIADLINSGLEKAQNRHHGENP
ncbi:MAG: aminoacyl-tRNA hydrolase [Micrococcaceae bacterium]